MGIALGWVAFFAAGVTAAAPAERNAPQITYTVMMVEAEGVGWREAAFARLKPVTRQGAATVWTLPKTASTSLLKQMAKSSPGTLVQAPRVTALSGVPATIQVRGNRSFVTQVVWNGAERAAEASHEEVRVGWHTTLVGRKLDQGIFVKMVLEDTEIRGVHKVKLNADRPTELKRADHSFSDTLQRDSKTARAYAFEGNRFESASATVDAKIIKLKALMDKAKIAFADGKYDECDALARRAMALSRNDLAAAMLVFKARFERRNDSATCGGTESDDRIAIEFPEIANQEVLGEWLIPNGECLLVSFGPHTVADKDGKAVVRERLAFVEADENNDVMVNSAARFNFVRASPISSVPHPVPSARAPISAPAPLPGPPVAIERAPVLVPLSPPAPDAKLPTPAPPSRSFPQGIHTDGSKTKLPPLPDDEMDDESSESESAEPLPSPQTKKPRKPKPEPASDTGTTKAGFTQPKSSTVFLPSVFLPGASVGFQFLLPIKPLSLRLPFNQRLKIEIFGRVVPDTRVTGP
jgi:hypothetical protein